MVQTVKGGLKAKQTLYLRYGKDFYKRIGKKGGAKSNNGGFGSTKVGADGLTGAQRAIKAGKKGGTISRRNRQENEIGRTAVTQ